MMTYITRWRITLLILTKWASSCSHFAPLQSKQFVTAELLCLGNNISDCDWFCLADKAFTSNFDSPAWMRYNAKEFSYSHWDEFPVISEFMIIFPAFPQIQQVLLLRNGLPRTTYTHWLFQKLQVTRIISSYSLHTCTGPLPGLLDRFQHQKSGRIRPQDRSVLLL